MSAGHAVECSFTVRRRIIIPAASRVWFRSSRSCDRTWSRHLTKRNGEPGSSSQSIGARTQTCGRNWNTSSRRSGCRNLVQQQTPQMLGLQRNNRFCRYDVKSESTDQASVSGVNRRLLSKAGRLGQITAPSRCREPRPVRGRGGSLRPAGQVGSRASSGCVERGREWQLGRIRGRSSRSSRWRGSG